MKEIKLEIKDTYENIVRHIYNNYDIVEPTKFAFTKIMNTNAKMRNKKEFKNVYSYEIEGTIILNDNTHKRNIFKKVCLPKIGQDNINFDSLGID